MIRVLRFIPSLATGGAERQLYLLCRHTANSAEHIVVAPWQEGRWADSLRAAGVEVRCLHTQLRDPRLIWRMRGEVKRLSPDLVHAWLPSMNLAAALAAFGHAPVAASVRNVDDWKPWPYRLADRLAAPLWRAVIANSHAGAAHIAQTSGLPVQTIRVVPNGIEHRDSPPKPVEALRRVFTLCRLVPQKRLDRVLAVARLLPGLQFRIAGAGPDHARLVSEAPGNVVFLGELRDPSPELDTAGFFLLTSEREGTSNALLEAMQSGCVPVVTPAGDNARIVMHDLNGRVAETPAGLAAALATSASDWTRLSEAARQSAARYTVPAMAEQTLSIYRSLTRKTRADLLPRMLP